MTCQCNVVWNSILPLPPCPLHTIPSPLPVYPFNGRRRVYTLTNTTG